MNERDDTVRGQMMRYQRADGDIRFGQRLQNCIRTLYWKRAALSIGNAKIDSNHFHAQPSAHIEKGASVSAANIEDSPHGFWILPHGSDESRRVTKDPIYQRQFFVNPNHDSSGQIKADHDFHFVRASHSHPLKTT